MDIASVARVGDTGFGKLRGLLGGRPAAARPAIKASKDEMQRAVMLLRDYENSGLGWFWSTDAEGKVDYISDCVARKLGKPREELTGELFHSLFILDHDEDERVERTLPLVLSGHKTFSELPARTALGGEETWWAISGRPQFSGSGEFTGYHGNGLDVTETRRNQKDASRLALFDSLTGLSNRRQMERRLESILAAYKAAKRSCALMMIDLDRFKLVNDTLGHPAGDELLRQVAQRMRDAVAKAGIVCDIGRLGGDEFQIIVPDLDDRGRLGEIGKTLISIVSQPYVVEAGRCVIGASVGIAIAPYDGVTSEELTRSADLALYASKGGGRGQFRFYSADLHAQSERRRQIEEDLRDALANRQMWLAYQPVVDAGSGKVVALEAQLRWTHPDLGEVLPAIFMPLAAERNLLGHLGDWALMQACVDAVQWPGGVRVAVDVSHAQFGNMGFPATVTQALSSSGLAPERLELEIAEAMLLGEDETAQHMFDALKVLGVRFTLDRFGDGYSALGFLRRLSLDKIKLDSAFVRGVTEAKSRNAAIVRSIVGLAKSLDMEIAADGIEAHDELGCLAKLGVAQVQGHIYGEALPARLVDEAMACGEWIIEPVGPAKYRPDRKTVFRKVGLIHEDHRYDATMRNLSRTGCMVEGLMDVPVDTRFVVDFGEGQLAVASVRRSSGAMQGLEFEQTLVDDGAGGLCTRHRVSPYAMAAAGMTAGALSAGQYPQGPGGMAGAFSMPKFAQANEAARKAMRKED